MNPREPGHRPEQSTVRTTALNRRAALRLGIPAALAVLGVKPVAAEPLDGKGNDVCPCFFGITEAVLNEDETITVSGPCAVANPPETVTVRVQVQGKRGARAIGSDSFECRGSETSQETFSLSVRVRGDSRFETGDTVAIRASVHINPDDKPAVAGRWTWTGPLT